MIASLQMYARPELEKAHRRFWSLIRAQLILKGIAAPNHLSVDKEEMQVWNDPELVFSQTCGMPYRKFLHNKVQLVGTPVYDIGISPEGYYCSYFVVRKDDNRCSLVNYCDAVFAFNEKNSQSGFAAPLVHLNKLEKNFSNRVQSFSHRQSASMVAGGEADICAIDALSWKLIETYDTFPSNLRVLTATKPVTPGLPYITSRDNDPKLVFTAVESAIKSLRSSDRKNLNIRGIVKIPEEKYLLIPNPE